MSFIADAATFSIASGTGTTTVITPNTYKAILLITAFPGTSSGSVVSESRFCIGMMDGSLQSATSYSVQDGISNPVAHHYIRTSTYIGQNSDPNVIWSSEFIASITLGINQFDFVVSTNVLGAQTFMYIGLGGDDLDIEHIVTRTAYSTGIKAIAHTLGDDPSSLLMMSGNDYKAQDYHSRQSFGVWDGTSESTISMYNERGGGSGTLSHQYFNDSYLIRSFGHSALESEASVSSVDSSNINVNLTNLSWNHAGRGGNNDYWHFLAMKGTSPEVITALTATSDGTKEYTFVQQPQSILVFATKQLSSETGSVNVPHRMWMFAVGSDGFAQTHWTTAESDLNVGGLTAEQKRGFDDSTILHILDPTDRTTLVKATLQSLAADGTVTFDYTTTDGNEYQFGIIGFAKALPTVQETMAALQPLELPTLPDFTAVPYRTH